MTPFQFAAMNSSVGDAAAAMVRSQVENDHAITAMQTEMNKLRHQVLVLQAEKAGVQAQLDVTHAELRKFAPHNPLFKETGLKYKNGFKQTKLSLFYEKAFDAFITIAGKIPEKCRSVAK